MPCHAVVSHDPAFRDRELTNPGQQASPPATDPRQVQLHAICDTIVNAHASRLTLVRAPTGFGKTTVMAQCRQRMQGAGVSTAWLTMDSADNDTSRFLAYLKAALDEMSRAEDWTAEPAAMGGLAVSLMTRASLLRPPLALFFDDYEVIHAPDVMALVAALLERLPLGGRLIIGSRALPNMRLGRLRAAGWLIEIDVQRLRFSVDETRNFFAMRPEASLSAGELKILHRRTEGWVATAPLFAAFVQRLRDAFGPMVQNAAPGEKRGFADAKLPLDSLTVEEIRVLSLLAEGHSNRALAEKLFVLASTVRAHLRNINASCARTAALKPSLSRGG